MSHNFFKAFIYNALRRGETVQVGSDGSGLVTIVTEDAEKNTVQTYEFYDASLVEGSESNA